MDSPKQKLRNAMNKPAFGSQWLNKAAKNPYWQSKTHAKGMKWAKWGLGLPETAADTFDAAYKTRGVSGVAGKLLNRGLGAFFTGLSVKEGYESGGMFGALKAGIKTTAENYFLGAFAGPLAIGAAATAVTGFTALGIYDPAFFSLKGWARPWVKQYRDQHKNLSFGDPSVDPFGNNGTMRQRALVAIQNSRLNARTALGSEAMRTHFR